MKALASIKTQLANIELPNVEVIQKIYWNNNSGIAFILCGYCSDTIDNYLALYDLAKQTFPKLKLSQATAGKVQAGRHYGYTFLSFEITGKKKYGKFANWDIPIDFKW